jgi:hypothetical protein
MKFTITGAGASLLLMVSSLVQAQPWQFDKPIAVADNSNGKTFHHLESSGRRNIAVSANTVAVAWEDDRDGVPRIYLARKNINGKAFTDDIKISGEAEAYEPALIALDNNRFAVVWEEGARIHLRLVTPDGLGPVVMPVNHESMQASLAHYRQQLLLVYSQREERFSRIMLQSITVDGQTLRADKACAVDAQPLKDNQLYPTVAVVDEQAIVAWEDRRPGHTIIMAAQIELARLCSFTSPQRISEGGSDQNAGYGKGHGVSRVALASYGTDRVLAAWADKRDFREGYDIYAADYQPAWQPEKQSLFGANSRVQDSFGGVAQQWHATVAGDATGRLVVAWDDNRDGNADIFLSLKEDDGWSDDMAVPGAHGDGEQVHPSIVLDEEGNLHMAWVERQETGGPTQLHYVMGKLIDN